MDGKSVYLVNFDLTRRNIDVVDADGNKVNVNVGPTSFQVTTQAGKPGRLPWSFAAHGFPPGEGTPRVTRLPAIVDLSHLTAVTYPTT
jgi:hypothetical protein